MMRMGIILALFGLSLPTLAELKLPSAIVVSAGGDRQDSVSSSIDATLTVPGNWQVLFGVDRSQIPDADSGEKLLIQGGRIGLSSNPMKSFAFDLSYRNWKMEEDIVSHGGEIGVMASGLDMDGRLSGGLETLYLSGLPSGLFSGGKSEIRDSFLSLQLNYYLPEIWFVRLTGSKHSYDRPLSMYAEGLRVISMPPAVLTTVTGFSSDDVAVAGGGDFGKIDGMVELGRSTSALDGVKVGRIRLGMGYRFNDSFRLSVELGTTKPEKSEDDPRDNRFGSVSLSYSWR